MDDYRKLLSQLPAQRIHSCPSCSGPVRCDVALGKSVCWCFGLQRKEQEYGDICMCSTCLTTGKPK